MEEAPKAPKTNKEKVAWLQAKLDTYATEGHQLARRVHVLTNTKEVLKRELEAARQEISDLRHRLAKELAWSEINLNENDVTRKRLHAVYMQRKLEWLESGG